MPSPLIEIPDDNIFKNDRLGLEPAITARTQELVSRSPQAVAIDGRWGSGKSTFLALWAAYLRSENIKVVEFNAWKSSQADPFATLTREILRQVEVPAPKEGSSHQRLVSFLRDSAPLVAQGFKLVSRLEPELDGVPQIAELALQTARNSVGATTNEDAPTKFESPEEFASVLSDAARTWSERPIVVMIDELDRCNPEYAVEMLELLEHVFHAEHVVFVVAINRSELIHSIKAFYGKRFNAEGYLERFFDDVQALPASNRRQYIETSLASTVPGNVSSALLFLETSGLSLREIDKSILHLNSVIASHSQPPIYDLMNLWIARSIAPVEYREFIAGEISDKALADAIFAKGTCNNLRTSQDLQENFCTKELEIILIGASLALPRGSASAYYGSIIAKSELYKMHKDISENELSNTDVSADYSRSIVDRFGTSPHMLLHRENLRYLRLASLLLEKEYPSQQSTAGKS